MMAFKRYFFLFLSIVALSNVKLVTNEQYFGLRTFNASAYKSSTLLFPGYEVVKASTMFYPYPSTLQAVTFLYTFQSKLYSIAPSHAPQHFRLSTCSNPIFSAAQITYRNSGTS